MDGFHCSVNKLGVHIQFSYLNILTFSYLFSTLHSTELYIKFHQIHYSNLKKSVVNPGVATVNVENELFFI